jgi:predicted metal-dependent hydrolase
MPQGLKYKNLHNKKFWEELIRLLSLHKFSIWSNWN